MRSTTKRWSSATATTASTRPTAVTVDGGAGNDHIQFVGGTFDGGESADSVDYLGGVFNGGAGTDSIVAKLAASSGTDVEVGC